MTTLGSVLLPPGAWRVSLSCLATRVGKSLVLRFSFKILTYPRIWAMFTNTSSISKRMILCISAAPCLFNLIFQLAQNQEEKRDVIYWMLCWTLKCTWLIARNPTFPSYQFFKLPLTKALGTYKSKRVVAQWSGSSSGSSTMNGHFLCCFLLKSDPALPDGQDSKDPCTGHWSTLKRVISVFLWWTAHCTPTSASTLLLFFFLSNLFMFGCVESSLLCTGFL